MREPLEVLFVLAWMVLAILPLLAIPLLIWQRKSTAARVIGTIMILVGILPLYALNEIWPPDYITGGGHAIPLDRNIEGYRVRIETDHGGDPYQTTLEITTPDGRTAFYLIFNDGPKWWWCRVVQEGDRYYFVRSFDLIDDETVWFNPTAATVGGYFADAGVLEGEPLKDRLP